MRNPGVLAALACTLALVSCAGTPTRNQASPSSAAAAKKILEQYTPQFAEGIGRCKIGDTRTLMENLWQHAWTYLGLAADYEVMGYSDNAARQIDNATQSVKDIGKWGEVCQRETACARDFHIGMTALEVRGCWAPDHVNRTVTSLGDREQWVYGDGRYLYFDHGVLTGMQTTEP